MLGPAPGSTMKVIYIKVIINSQYMVITTPTLIRYVSPATFLKLQERNMELNSFVCCKEQFDRSFKFVLLLSGFNGKQEALSHYGICVEGAQKIVLTEHIKYDFHVILTKG